MNGASNNGNQMPSTDSGAQSFEQSVDSGKDDAKPEMKMN
jgi:hypothetical protein